MEEIAYYTGRTWKVRSVGDGDGDMEHLPPDNVEIDEEIKFVEDSGKVLAQMVSQRFGDRNLKKCEPSWHGLSFEINESDGKVTLIGQRLIWDRCRGKHYWHTLKIAPKNGGIECEYRERRSGVGDSAKSAAAGGHTGTWHADD